MDLPLSGVHMDVGGVENSVMILLELRRRADGLPTALVVQNKCECKHFTTCVLIYCVPLAVYFI